MYIIAEYFLEGGANEVEVVPQSWFDKTKNTCWWPPSNFTAKKVNSYVIKQLPHDARKWVEYKAKSHATFSKEVIVIIMMVNI